MLREEGFEIEDKKLGTALYYGLYTDTNQFAEIFNPLDMDMREGLPCEKVLKIYTLLSTHYILHRYVLPQPVTGNH